MKHELAMKTLSQQMGLENNWRTPNISTQCAYVLLPELKWLELWSELFDKLTNSTGFEEKWRYSDFKCLLTDLSETLLNIMNVVKSNFKKSNSH